MVQKSEETRRCIICGSTDVIVDVRKVVGYNLNLDTMRMEYESIDPPRQYCNKHFISEVWNKKGKS